MKNYMSVPSGQLIIMLPSNGKQSPQNCRLWFGSKVGHCPIDSIKLNVDAGNPDMYCEGENLSITEISFLSRQLLNRNLYNQVWRSINDIRSIPLLAAVDAGSTFAWYRFCFSHCSQWMNHLICDTCILSPSISHRWIYWIIEHNLTKVMISSLTFDGSIAKEWLS